MPYKLSVSIYFILNKTEYNEKLGNIMLKSNKKATKKTTALLKT